MHPLQTVKLAEGTYSAQEARELVIGLINHEINALHIRNLSSEIRFGKPDEKAWATAEKLKEEKERLLRLFKKAEAEKTSLKINSNIHISIEHV